MAIGVKHILDYDDYTAIPSDGRRYELLNGDLHVTPAPSPRQQWTRDLPQASDTEPVDVRVVFLDA